MIIFMTSLLAGNYKQFMKIPYQGVNEDNGLVENLRKVWPIDARCLFVVSQPDNYQMADNLGKEAYARVRTSGLSCQSLAICDHRDMDCAASLDNYDVIILSGGHVPTANAFLHEIGLKEKLADFKGILIGISAGSMNQAKEVYAQPEEQGEPSNPDYVKFLLGLGTTDISVLPHYQVLKNEIVDGMRLFEDVTYKDSMGRKFYAIEDGTYILIKDGKTTVYGAAYLLEDGKLSQICKKDQQLEIK